MQGSQPPHHDEGSLPWLVKTSGRILGPLTRDELVQKLESKELVLLDEVALPQQRWKYIRDEPVFAKVVEELRRASYGGREDTMTSTGTIGTRSLTEEIESADDFSITMDLGKQDERSWHSKPEGAPSGLRKPEVQAAQIPTKTRATWPAVVGAGIVVLGALFAVYQRQQTQNGQETGYGSLVQQGMELRSVGDYQQAMTLFKKAHELRPDDAEINFILGPMLIAIDGQTQAAKQMLEKVLLLKYRPPDVAQTKTALGYAALLDSNPEQAKDYFSAALEAQKQFYPALANMGVVLYLQGEYQSSQDYFAQALNENRDDNSLFVLMNRSQIESEEKKSRHSPVFVEIAKTLKNVIADGLDYRQEAFLLSAYASTINGSTPDEAAVDEVLEMDPQLTEDHTKEILIYRQPITWPALLPVCQRIQGSEPTAHRKTLMAYCYLKAGNQIEAQRLMEPVVRKSPADTLVHAHYAWLLKDMGKISEARAALVTGNSPFSLLTEARICEAQDDLTCAENAYQKLLDADSHVMQSLAGLGRIALKKQDVSRANQMVSRGLQVDARYIPLLQLQRAINAQSK